MARADDAKKLAHFTATQHLRKKPMLRRALAVAIVFLVLPSALWSALEDGAAPSIEPPLAAADPARTTVAPAQAAAPAAAAPVAPKKDEAPSLCGPDMVLVEGEYCSEVEQKCVRWLDDEKLPFARCGDYAPSRCTAERKHLRFCIDKYEYTPPGEKLPQNFASYQIASRTCKGLGKRLCTESEWTFACEGEEMRPYPYGFSRKPVCNYDKSDLYEMKDNQQVLKDLRAAPGAHPECVSPFGVYDMAGNVDEPTRRENAWDPKFNNSLKGGWWMAARNRCRPATTAHDDYYKDIQVGVRCCDDAPTSVPESSG